MSDQYGGFGQPPQQWEPPSGAPYQPPQQQTPPPYQPGPMKIPGRTPRSGGIGIGGCLLGCLVVVVVLFLIIAGSMWYTYGWAKKNLLEDTPMAIQTHELTDSQQKALKVRLAPIAKAFEANTGEIVELTLNQDELNWLIVQTQQNQKNMVAKLAFEFPDNGVLAFRTSVPIGAPSSPQQPSGAPYLNIQGKTEFDVTDKLVKVKIIEGQIGKWKPPQNFLQAFNDNFAQQLQKEQKLQWVWERLQDAKIEKGKAHLKLRALKLP